MAERRSSRVRDNESSQISSDYNRARERRSRIEHGADLVSEEEEEEEEEEEKNENENRSEEGAGLSDDENDASLINSDSSSSPPMSPARKGKCRPPGEGKRRRAPGMSNGYSEEDREVLSRMKAYFDNVVDKHTLKFD